MPAFTFGGHRLNRIGVSLWTGSKSLPASLCKIYEARFAKLIGMAEPDKDDEKGGMTDE
jgi:hypothetical protein